MYVARINNIVGTGLSNGSGVGSMKNDMKKKATSAKNNHQKTGVATRQNGE